MTPEDHTDHPFAFDAAQPDHQVAAEQGDEDKALAERVLEALKTVFDPEIPVNIVELGLIYDLTATKDGAVEIEMTLTTPMCPVAGAMPGQVEETAKTVEGVKSCTVDLVWTPPWSPELMTEEAKLQLGMF